MRGGIVLVGTALVAEAFRLAVLARLPVHPDLLLGLVVLAALAYRSPAGAVIGFGLGFVRDVAYGLPAGFEALPLSIVGWVVGSLGRSVYRESMVTQGIVIFLAVLGTDVYGYVFLRGGEMEGIFAYLLRVSTASAVETAVVVPLIYRAVQDLVRPDYRRAVLGLLKQYEKKLLVKRH